VQHLIIFTRYPTPGLAKTRLIPVLGTVGAATLHQQMAEHTLAQVRHLQKRCPITVEIQFTGSDRAQMAAWLGADLTYQPQCDGDLGDRMQHACQTAFTVGADAVILIGTDCPDLEAALLATACQQLQTHDLVIGPASDGGYYLIGLQRFMPELFRNMPWSTSTVLSNTLAIARQNHLATYLLPVLTDVDYPQDLPVWENAKSRKVQGE
jgi:uncharacterized protein